MNIALCILKLFPTARPNGDFMVTSHGIVKWALKDAAGNLIPQPTPTELSAAWQSVKVDLAREAKLSTLSKDFEKQCAEGVDAGGIRLSCDDAGRAALDQLRSHETARISLAADDATRAEICEEPFALKDASGELRPMTVGAAIEAIISAGETYKALWSELAEKQAAVKAAATVEAVNGIASVFKATADRLKSKPTVLVPPGASTAPQAGFTIMPLSEVAAAPGTLAYDTLGRLYLCYARNRWKMFEGTEVFSGGSYYSSSSGADGSYYTVGANLV